MSEKTVKRWFKNRDDIFWKAEIIYTKNRKRFATLSMVAGSGTDSVPNRFLRNLWDYEYIEAIIFLENGETLGPALVEPREIYDIVSEFEKGNVSWVFMDEYLTEDLKKIIDESRAERAEVDRYEFESGEEEERKILEDSYITEGDGFTPNYRGAEDFVDFLQSTLIPDLMESDKKSTAKDFREAIYWIHGGQNLAYDRYNMDYLTREDD